MKLTAEDVLSEAIDAWPFDIEGHRRVILKAHSLLAAAAEPKTTEGALSDEAKFLLGVGQKFPEEQQQAIDLVMAMKSTGEHKGKENSGLLYALDVIVNLIRLDKATGEAPETMLFLPLGDTSLHFDNADVLANVQDSEYAKKNIQRHLMFMTCNERWSLYRAIVKMSREPKAEGASIQVDMTSYSLGFKACQQMTKTHPHLFVQQVEGAEKVSSIAGINGNYVLLEDYQKLESRNAELQEAIELMERMISDISNELGCGESALSTISVVAMGYKDCAEKAEREVERLKRENENFSAFVRLSEHKLDQRLQGQYTNEQILGMLLKIARQLMLEYGTQPLDPKP